MNFAPVKRLTFEDIQKRQIDIAAVLNCTIKWLFTTYGLCEN